MIFFVDYKIKFLCLTMGRIQTKVLVKLKDWSCKMERFKIIIAEHLILIENERVLLLRR